MTTVINMSIDEYKYLAFLLEKLCNTDVKLYVKTNKGYLLIYETKETP